MIMEATQSGQYWSLQVCQFRFSIKVWRTLHDQRNIFAFTFTVLAILFSTSLGFSQTVKMWSLLFLVFASVNCQLAPQLAESFAKKSQNVGTKLKLSCTVQQGSKPLQFEWFKNDRLLLIEDLHFQIKHEVDDSELIIPELNSRDSGNYSCIVRNSIASDSQSTLILVKGLPFCCISHYSRPARIDRSFIAHRPIPLIHC